MQTKFVICKKNTFIKFFVRKIGIVYLFIDYIKTRNLKFISIYFLMHAVVSRSVFVACSRNKQLAIAIAIAARHVVQRLAACCSRQHCCNIQGAWPCPRRRRHMLKAEGLWAVESGRHASGRHAHHARLHDAIAWHS